jgi:putative ABC transport system permease protein
MKANTVDDPCIERYGVTPDYARLMGIPLRRGRFISTGDTSTSQPVLVVSESTAKLVWGSDDPIGSQVRLGEPTTPPWYTVVGVVGDVHHEDVTQPVTAAMYTAEAQFTDSFLVAIVKASTGDPAALTSPVRQVLRELDASVPVYGIATLPALVQQASAQRLFVMQLLSGFAAVAVLLAAIGLYGVVSYGVAQRTREVAVRVALGAQRGEIFRLVLWRGLGLVGIGLAIGLVCALAATRLLGTLTFGVSPVDPPTFLSAAVLLALVALAAHVVPIRRALRIDPAEALRAE